MAEDFGYRLAYLRSQHGLSGEKLAEKAGLSEHHIRWLEYGKSKPTLDSLIKLLRALGDTSPEELLRGQYDAPEDFLSVLLGQDAHDFSHEQIHLLTTTVEFLLQNLPYNEDRARAE